MLGCFVFHRYGARMRILKPKTIYFTKSGTGDINDPEAPAQFSKQDRLPREEAVTIAAGLLCTDGIVIAADTQETGYMKNEDAGLDKDKSSG